MERIKIKTYGFKGCRLGINQFENAVIRVEHGFKDLGHCLVDNYEDADLVYCSDLDSCKNCIMDSLESDSQPFKVFGVLDIPHHLIGKTFHIDRAKKWLSYANVVACNSLTVQKDIFNVLGLKSFVINHPCQSVFHHITDEVSLKTYKYLFIGRANDPNKRFSLIKEVFNKYNIDPSELGVAGTENPLFGDYIGEVNNCELQFLYENAQYVFLPSASEGIGLPMIEGVIHDCIPICMTDNQTAAEFLGYDLLFQSVEEVGSFLTNNTTTKDFSKLENLKENFYHKFNRKTVAQNIINLYKNNV